MNTTTLLIPRELDEQNLSSALEKEFDAAWFPEYHRWSIETVGATVYVDADADYASNLDPDERQQLTTQLGFVPRAALFVSPSKYYPDSGELAAAVLDLLRRLLDGRTLAVA